MERIGKQHTANVIHIEATQLEYRTYERLKNKQTLQGVLLDLPKEMENNMTIDEVVKGYLTLRNRKESMESEVKKKLKLKKRWQS